ncbi:MAG: BCCT family transporter [Desulfobacterium sp.]|nr:BCCT family transporter [Desulfobacterium sp.]
MSDSRSFKESFSNKNFDPVLFWSTLAIVMSILFWGWFNLESFEKVLGSMHGWVTVQFRWFFMYLFSFILLFLYFIAFSKYGNLKLGKAEDKPEYSTFSWIAMLFSVGIGAGYAYWTIGEPLLHWQNTPYLAESGSQAAQSVGIAIGIFHWGFHSWGIFALVGMAIAFPAYRYGMPLNISTSLYGLLGEKWCNSKPMKVVEIITIASTILGISTVIGLGIQSTKGAFKYLLGIELSDWGVYAFILVLSLCFISSAVSGIKRGIKHLSTLSIFVGFIWLFFILFSGPTATLLNGMSQATGTYFQNIIYMSFFTDYPNNGPWLGWWTIFYFMFWAAFAPFSGGFIARISRGRTLREFVLGVTVIPTFVSIVWFSVIGGAGQWAEINKMASMVESVKVDFGESIYLLMTVFDGGYAFSWLVFLSVFIFIVTTADSASFFAGMQMSRGSAEPHISVRGLQGLLMAGMAVLMTMAGGLSTYQMMAVMAGLPISLLMLFMTLSLFKLIKKEYEKEQVDKRIAEIEEQKILIRKTLQTEMLNSPK